MAITVISDTTDKRGITLRLLHDAEKHEVIVEVSSKSPIIGGEDKIRTQSFKGNRWGIQIVDSVKAVKMGVSMAEAMDKDLGFYE